MTKRVVLSIVLLSSFLRGEGLAVKSVQKKPQYDVMKQEGEAFKEKSMKMSEKWKKTKSYPRGSIETH